MELSVIHGTVERIVFHNSENGWTVCRLATEPEDEIQTIVGYLPGLSIGQAVEVSGQWKEDPKWGRQFKVESFQLGGPRTLVGLEKYLGSGIVPGIGPELAKRIVAKFGAETLKILEAAPERLTEVEGIGSSRVDAIKEHYGEQKELQSLLIFLQGHGVSPTFAPRIFQRYGADAVRIIRENPYRMAIDIWGIGFRTADSMAANLGIEPTSAGRLEAGVLHVLGEDVENGHVHSPKEHLMQRAQELLSVDVEYLDSALSRLELANLIIVEDLQDRGLCVSLWRMWEMECAAATRLATILDAGNVKPSDKIDKAAESCGVTLTEEQKFAVTSALNSRCCAITGGPGVGKTTIVQVIVNACQLMKKKVELCAPTGRAAKRLSEAAGLEARTIHRLLEFQPHEASFARCLEMPLETDVVVVDEASMVDLQLFHALLLALPDEAQLILVGDADQLPSVGAGNVLDDLLASDHVTRVRLTQVFRQAANSLIIQVAHQINQGEVPEVSSGGGDEDLQDLYFIERGDPQSVRETLLEVVCERIPKRFGLNPKSDVQVLTPMHRGALGTTTLNQELQKALNPLGDELKRGDRAYRVGDKVMQIKNDYDRGIYNGDIGEIVAVDAGEFQLHVDFGYSALVTYDRAALDQLIHAYAISVHKSQGSEYPCVVIPVSTQHYVMLQRNLLYTAVTRGKSLVVLIGSSRALALATRTESSRMRYSWLRQRVDAAVQRATHN